MFSLTANHQGNLIPLVSYWKEKSVQPHKYDDFQDMYTSILNILKNNNFYVGKYVEFNAIWYDIQWIDMDNPIRVDKFAYLKK